MFNRDFYPTPPEVIERMLEGLQMQGKTVWEPSAGRGDIVDSLQSRGAEVVACETDPHLVQIIRNKCQIIAEDMLTVTSDRVSHVQYVIMNPPFSAEEDHIMHAWDIAPPGCKIRALMNGTTLKNAYTAKRKRLKELVELHGHVEDLGDCFATAARTTNVSVSMVTMDKPGASESREFEGFFMDEDDPEQQENGIMSYNAVRDIVNRYVTAIKIYDQQLESAVMMENVVKDVFWLRQSGTDRDAPNIALRATMDGAPIMRKDFKIRMQIAGWDWIFEKMNLQKYATRGLKEDINRFVNQQKDIPFTMKNIYRMLDIVVGTASQRMDKALEEVFDTLTSHSEENKYAGMGFKTNSHFMLSRRFIIPSYRREEFTDDLLKAICWLTGDNYDRFLTLDQRTRYPYSIVNEAGDFVSQPGYSFSVKYLFHHYEIKDGRQDRLLRENPTWRLQDLSWEYGKWFDWSHFRVRKYKNGNMHFEFKDDELWAKLNQRIAKIKGYPLFQGAQQTAYQDRMTGRAQQKKASGWKGGQKAEGPKPGKPAQQAKILFTAKVNP